MSLKPMHHPLKAKLRRAGLTQVDAAAFVNLSPAWMRLILTGHQAPSAKVQAKLDELEELIDIAD
ncbi:helix-turn-helix domain-containing protein [Fundidesulfovibrio magnetotacticus]|uniref:helix-turn-helix domain-containing protein n=1 Tax=Fundidesulfovibrio magnetotacticus TaxID=2730080 RepID=UPI0015654497|nr:helix-turn-helix transcriptional regulator [Fundidesulfovibrio magnetotacticus]